MSRQLARAQLQVVNEPTRAVAYQVIPANPIQTISTGEAFISDDPELERRVAHQHLDGGRAQRIGLSYDGGVRNMYIDDLAQLKDLPRNERATSLYRAGFIAANPFINPESLPFIAGNAVLFEEPRPQEDR